MAHASVKKKLLTIVFSAALFFGTAFFIFQINPLLPTPPVTFQAGIAFITLWLTGWIYLPFLTVFSFVDFYWIQGQFLSESIASALFFPLPFALFYRFFSPDRIKQNADDAFPLPRLPFWGGVFLLSILLAFGLTVLTWVFETQLYLSFPTYLLNKWGSLFTALLIVGCPVVFFPKGLKEAKPYDKWTLIGFVASCTASLYFFYPLFSVSRIFPILFLPYLPLFLLTIRGNKLPSFLGLLLLSLLFTTRHAGEVLGLLHLSDRYHQFFSLLPIVDFHFYRSYMITLVLFNLVLLFLSEDRRRHVQSQQTKEAQVRTILDTIPAMAWFKDPAGAYLAANKACIAAAGKKTEAELIGRTDMELFPKHARAYRKDDQEILSSCKPKVCIEQVQMPDKEIWVETTKAPIIGEKGKLIGMTGIAYDITRRYLYQKALEKERIEAQEAAQAKTDFLAHIGHELRSPLNAIIGFSDIIHKEVFGPIGSDQYREYADNVITSANHLRDMINDLLDLSKGTAGKEQINETTVDIRKIVEDSVAISKNLPGATNQIFMLDLDETYSQLFADERMIRQILINLLSNAVKFSPENGRIIVSSRFQYGNLSLCVSDTGIGMTKEEIKLYAEPFARAENAETASTIGTGLGGALVKSFIEQHDGQLQVRSEKGKGTRVCAIFPSERVIKEGDPPRKEKGK